MAKQVSLKASLRSSLGRQGVKKVRATGTVPGILYGAHIQPLPIQVVEGELTRIFKHATSENMLVDLALEENGKTTNRLAFIQEIQHHPVHDRILHLDLHEVRADEKLHARVMVVPIGEAEGVRTGGGTLEQVMHELEVECLPRDLPDHIEVDVSALQIGANVHVSQVKAPEKVTILSRSELSVFTVLAPTKEEEVVAAAPEAAAEPEVIKQKKPEEGEAPPEKGGKAEAKGAAKAAEGKGGETKAGAKGAAEAKGAGAKAAGKPAAKEDKK